MKKTIFTLLAGGLILLASTQAIAHTMWVNLFRSTGHAPGHALATLGWGHSLPLDDLLVSAHAVMELDGYELIDPDLNRTPLPMPRTGAEKPKVTPSGITLQSGDLGICKLGLAEDIRPGTYQVSARAKDTYFTSYIDQGGKTKMAPVSMDKIENPKKILTSMKYGAYAKSYMAVGAWTPPRPLGHDLEIMPQTDLTRVRTGDLVPFKITFMGKPIQRFEDGTIQYITATSKGFGGPDGFFLSSYITDGHGQFRMPTAGQWIVNVYFKQKVEGNQKLKAFADKCNVVYCSATVSFDVKP